MKKTSKFPVVNEPDIVAARAASRDLAKALGFSTADQTRLATAISELTRNILRYAGEGRCEIVGGVYGDQAKITVVVEDNGPGIPDLAIAMEDGFTTGGGLGAGLPGTKRLVHEFDIVSQPGLTRITIGMASGQKASAPEKINATLGRSRIT